MESRQILNKMTPRDPEREWERVHQDIDFGIINFAFHCSQDTTLNNWSTFFNPLMLTFHTNVLKKGDPILQSRRVESLLEKCPS